MSAAPAAFAILTVLAFLYTWGVGRPGGSFGKALWLTAPAFTVPLIALIIWKGTHSEPLTWIVSGLLFAISFIGFRLLVGAALSFS